MAETKMARVALDTNQQELEDGAVVGLLRALVVEDYDPQREEIVQDLTELGFSVDAFAYPIDAAACIADAQYHLSIVDIVFEEGPHISGDEFVRKNFDVLCFGRIVAFTAYPGNILEENNGFFDKKFLKGSGDEALQRYARSVSLDALAKSEFGEGKSSVDEEEWMVAETKMLELLGKIKDKNAKIVWYKGKDLSANELIDEVKDRTSIGRSHIRMMLKRLSHRK